MVDCGLINLGTCLPQRFFEFLVTVINAPIQPFLQFTLNLLSEPINIHLFANMWAIVVYVISMFYALLIVGAGFNIMTSGYSPAKREKAKEWLRNVLIMIVLVQASFFIYELAIDLSASITSGTLTLIDQHFFQINITTITDLGTAIFFGLFYLVTLIITSLVLIVRYAFVAIGVALFPLAIFFYFIPVLRPYGSLLLNFLGTAIFVTAFDALLLAGFSQLATLPVFGSMAVLVLIAAFGCINLVMLFLLCFGVIKSAFGVYHDVKRFKF